MSDSTAGVSADPGGRPPERSSEKEPAARPGARTGGLRRILVALLGVAALGLVAYVVPLRDRCAPQDVATASSMKKVATDRKSDGTCTLQLPAGPLELPSADCASLKCEPGLLPVLAHAKVGVLALLALITILGTLLSTLRWYSLLRLAGFTRSFGWVWRTCLQSQAGALLLPGGVGGDALRFTFTLGAGKGDANAQANQEAIPTATIAATVLLDRVLGLVSLTTLGGVLAALFGGPATGKMVLFLLVIPPLFFAGFALARTDFVLGWPIWKTGIGSKLEPVLLYIRRPGAFGAVARGLLASAFFSALQLGVVRGTVYALATPGHAIGADHWVFLGGAIGLLVSGLPGLPGGWGTADAAYVYFLGLAGLASSTSLAVCLLNRIFYYGVAAVGAGVLLASSVSNASNASSTDAPGDGPA